MTSSLLSLRALGSLQTALWLLGSDGKNVISELTTSLHLPAGREKLWSVWKG